MERLTRTLKGYLRIDFVVPPFPSNARSPGSPEQSFRRGFRNENFSIEIDPARLMLRSALVLLSTLVLAGCQRQLRPANELIVMQTEAPRSMDPADHTETYTTAVLDPMYEGLTRF